MPQDWARTQSYLAAALDKEGRLVGGDAAVALFTQAVQSFQNTLAVYTKADFPQDWARTQVTLGDMILDQSSRKSGETAAFLLNQAVIAYRLALEVFTKLGTPQLWARTQWSLGAALANQGEQASGDDANALFSQAAKAYQAALEIYTKANQPKTWAMIENNLGGARLRQGDYLDAATAFESYLEIFPDDVRILYVVASIEHDLLYRFDRAFEFAERSVKLNPSSDTRIDFAQTNLTVARFDDCVGQAATIDDANLSAYSRLAPYVVKLACQWGAGQRGGALVTAKVLSQNMSILQKSTRSFDGTLHFLAESPAYEKGRSSWIQLFESVQNGDGTGMVVALRELEAVMQD
jgi:tetratricopeptide (TPR) repeat protein